MITLGSKYDFVGLYSGGLDSSLAIKLMTMLGYKVLGVKFITPFLHGKMKKSETLYFNAELKADIMIIPLGQEYIDMVLSPRYGYGKNMNPCIDCKIFFLKRAKKIMDDVEAKGIITGEVVGQRPMSQNTNAMKVIERESGLEGMILRPLSARLLEPTEIEKAGIVKREYLLDISGRSRKNTLLLAERFGVKNFGSPAGGCLLTDPAFSLRLKDAFIHGEVSLNKIEALKFGRHFRLESGAKLIVGRNKEENEYLIQLFEDMIIIEPADVPGPTCFLSPFARDVELDLATRICARYSDKNKESRVAIKIKKADLTTVFYVEPAVDEVVKRYIIAAH